MSAIEQAVEVMGSQTALAQYFGIKPQAVRQWIDSGSVPANRVIGIEKATSGKVSRHQLRPDLYPE